MFKIELSEEARYGLIFLLSLVVVLIVMLLLNYMLGGSDKAPAVEKEKVKTVIVSQAKQDAAPQKIAPKSVVSTVRDAIKQGNYSTAYIEINNVPKTSPEYEELKKALVDETRRRKAPSVRKDAGVSSSAPVRYFDESTPRTRDADALYVYFVDLSGTMLPRFCIQNAARHPLGITGFVITADGKSIKIDAPFIKQENIEKGVAEWFDVPLDRHMYDTAQAIIKAKKVSLSIIGTRGKATRDVTNDEKKGIRQILDGYAALGGSWSYLQDSKFSPTQTNPKK